MVLPTVYQVSKMEIKEPPRGERVKINVGGLVYETSLSTLTRVSGSVLAIMVRRRQGQEELFVDRDATHFDEVLDYLRDGQSYTAPEDDEIRESLRREAMFYNLPGLVKKCSDEIFVGDWVKWKRNAIDKYWKFFIRYQRQGNRQTKCMACGSSVSGYVGPSISNEVTTHAGTAMNTNKMLLIKEEEDWTPLLRHMRFMKGSVIEVDSSCCRVKWGRNLETHLPRSVLPYAKVYNRLFEDLLGKYNRLVRPAVDPNDTIHIEFKLKLSQIVDIHAKDQTLTANGWLIHHWYDHRLSWNPEEYGGVRHFHLPGEMIWLPDIILYNNAHGSPWVSAITKAEVYHDGRVTWIPPVVYHSFCPINIEWYPYDIQQCELKFGSWTYSGTQLDLMHLLSDDVHYVIRNNESEWDVERGVDVSAYQESVEWDLLSVLSTRHEKWYPCCDYPSIDITYYVQIRRKKLFYTVNLIVPCASLAALTSWVFYLPCESHQKVQLCISILVSLTVFFLLLVEIIPPTSIAIPLIVKYLTFTMFMVSLSVILTVIVQNFHFRTADFPISDWVRRIIIEKLGRRLLISRATEKANFHRKAQHNKQINALSAMSILQKQFHKTVFEIEMATKEKKQMSTVNSLFLDLPLLNRSKSVKQGSLKRTMTEKPLRKQSTHASPTRRQEPDNETGTRVRNQLKRAERNVQYIAQTLTERRKAEENEADWQFISMVIDRILLIIFAISISVGTLLTIVSAPSITDTREPITTTYH
ncbi:unnamed protein product [Cylicocyclus nassatus]|uniref:BTB domain-containing protein n=1 Tax=Cylicocyclus nassatus TaxID=53992 RepID=A0AA36GKR3_CYLNA|nr:unnamed protein product [Cylicocyclus nassatus]